MREQIRDKERLEHILHAINILLEYKQKYTIDDVISNPIIFFGFVKHVEIIGEAVYKLTIEFRNAHPQVEWDVIEGMRHILVHGYYQIKPTQVWKTIDEDIELLKPLIEQFINEG
ncbi:MAG: DUF86 domain-containing protein [Bacteroidaceae bacterium]|nr:DUF86 domain-containing protein [Bacteroidaceae bacterium]